MILSRRAALLLPLAAAACTDTAAPTTFAPLTYDYLNPIGLNVARVDVEQRAVPPGGPADVTALSPVDPATALRQLGSDRLRAYGPTGAANFVITDATLLRRGGGYEGTLGVQLDIYAAPNTRAAYAEARVYRRIETDDDTRVALYSLVKQLMDAMNVELEFQVRRSLKDWLLTGPVATPAPVQSQPLAAPGAPTAVSPPPAPSLLAPPQTPPAFSPYTAPQSPPVPIAPPVYVPSSPY